MTLANNLNELLCILNEWNINNFSLERNIEFKNILRVDMEILPISSESNSVLQESTSEAGITYPSGAPELTLVFKGFVLLQL